MIGGVTMYFMDMNSELIEFKEKYSKAYSDIASDTENLILSEHISLSPKSWITGLNTSSLVFGSTGTGKTFNIVIPEILSCNCSYVIVDPSGYLLKTTGCVLEENGYDIKVLNLCKPAMSEHYNPFVYIPDNNKEILEHINLIATCLLDSTDLPSDEERQEQLAERALLSAFLCYVVEEYPKEKRTLVEAINLLCISEHNINIFKQKTSDNLSGFLYEQYITYKKAAKKSANEIFYSLVRKLKPFREDFVSKKTLDFLKNDTLDLMQMGSKKTALFLVIPQADCELKPLVPILYSQICKTIRKYTKEINENNVEDKKRIPIHVRFLLEEAAVYGAVPDLGKLTHQIYGYNMSYMFFFQNYKQFKTVYGKNTEYKRILENVGSIIYMGSQDAETQSIIIDYICKKQHDLYGSYTMEKSDFKAKKLLHDSVQQEIHQLKKKECIILCKGCKPIKDQKFNTIAHLNWDKNTKKYEHMKKQIPEFMEEY